MRSLLGIFLVSFSLVAIANSGKVEGIVLDMNTGEPVPFCNVVIEETNYGTITDENGKFIFEEVTPGTYNLLISFIGYETKTLFNIEISNFKTTFLEVNIEKSSTELEEVVVSGQVALFEKDAVSPVSQKKLTANEIERFPGGNRDISRVIQALPGVSSAVSYRNDIIVRGGNPNENTFYVDGIEIPDINHFSTQGASGGSNGYINVDFIESVDFASGAFPANRGGALSSVMQFDFKDGQKDQVITRFTLGALEAGVSLQGPLSKKRKATFIASYRRSYQQLLFRAFQLPFLPTYNDIQFKIKYRHNNKHELTVLGFGAYDKFKLNLDANETAEQQYLLGFLPYFNQWNYTVGARYRYFTNTGNIVLVASRSQISNDNFKYRDNENDNPDALIFDYHDNESENKLRFEQNYLKKGYKINYGAGYELADFSARTTGTSNDGNMVSTSTNLLIHKFGLFAQVSKSYVENKLKLALGLRVDFNSYSSTMANPLDQFSPRFSLSYAITPALNINFNTGRYLQLPPITTLAYADTAGQLVNRNRLKYIESTHVVLGFDYSFQSHTNIAIEGFYKHYRNYPFLLSDSISLANLGAEYGVVGNEPANSSSRGRTYGVEASVQQKLFKGFYGIMSYTWARSEFENEKGEFIPSSWDRSHVFSLSLGKKFKRNWEVSTRFSFATGNPYTPYDDELSSQKTVWDANGEGILDYRRLNAERTEAAYQLDIRADKTWFFKKWTLNLYLDIRNVLFTTTDGAPSLTVVRDNEGKPVTDPDNSSRYQTYYLSSEDGFILPSLGVVVEF